MLDDNLYQLRYAVEPSSERKYIRCFSGLRILQQVELIRSNKGSQLVQTITQISRFFEPLTRLAVRYWPVEVPKWPPNGQMIESLRHLQKPLPN